MVEQTREAIPSSISPGLHLARAAFDKGARNDAYQLATELTQQDPRNVDAWLLRAWTAQGLEESLNCLSRIIALDPQHSDAQQTLHHSLQRFLEDDAFLAYVGESTATYYIRTNTGMVLIVPKKRAVTEPYPPRESSLTRQGYRRLSLALFGLPLAGLGTFLFAPLAMLSAYKAARQARTEAEQIRALIVIVAALILCGLAIPIILLFLMHL